MSREGKVLIETGNFDNQVVGNIISYKQYDVTDLGSGYTPVKWDVVARDASATNDIVKYDVTDANHVVMGIVLNYDASYTDADLQIIEKAERIDLDSLLIANLSTDAHKLTATEALRDKGLFTL